MKFSNDNVFNFEGAFRGMRNPLNSWNKSDSDFSQELPIIGPNDMTLAKRLINGGSEHRKFLRQILVSVDITGPLYWWKEMDTYKVGTTANSTSTMHKLASTPITLDCFETGDIVSNLCWTTASNETINLDNNLVLMIHTLEELRLKYIETKDTRYWKELVRWLPEGWLQTRTWTANYEILHNIYHQRKAHKLVEWREFCSWIETLPYAKELILCEEE